MTHEDILGRLVSVGDYVVSYNNIYQVTELLGNPRLVGYGTVRIMLVDPSKTTKSKKTSSKEVCKIDAEDVLIWKIKRGY